MATVVVCSAKISFITSTNQGRQKVMVIQALSTTDKMDLNASFSN